MDKQIDGDDGRDDKWEMVAVLDYHTVARMKNAYDIQMDNNPLSSACDGGTEVRMDE